MQKSYTFGPNSSKPAEVYETDDYGTGGLVYTRDRVQRNYITQPLINPNFGISQAQNGAFSGTPDLIHDGTDTAAWTGSNIIGSKVTFNSTTKAFAGTKSVEVANPSVNDVWQFLRASTINLSGYTAITMKVYVDKEWSSGDSIEIFGYDSATASIIGTSVKLESYINEFEFDVWQVAAIPLIDMGIESSTLDAFRMSIVGKDGQAPTFYIDNFQVEQTSGALVYSYAPKDDEIFHITSFALSVTNNVTGTVIRNYNQWFGETALSNGILIQVQAGGIEQPSFGITQISQLLSFPQNRPLEVVAGSTETIATISTDFEINLDGRKNDFFKVTVRDDLTVLINQTYFLFGWLEGV